MGLSGGLGSSSTPQAQEHEAVPEEGRQMSRVEEGDDGCVGSPVQSPPHHRAWDVTEADICQDEAASPSGGL